MPRFRSVSALLFLVVAILSISANSALGKGPDAGFHGFVFRFGFGPLRSAGSECQCNLEQRGEGNHARFKDRCRRKLLFALLSPFRPRAIR